MFRQNLLIIHFLDKNLLYLNSHTNYDADQQILDIMDTHTNSSNSPFKKKVFSKLESSPLANKIDVSSPDVITPAGSGKKIIFSSPKSGVREEFKRTFLPLLIDVSELRQMIENYKAQKDQPYLLSLGKLSKTPEEVLKELESMQTDIEEAKRWCSGVILQISQAITEAKEALAPLEENEKQEKKPSTPFQKLKELFSFLRKKAKNSSIR